MMSTMRRSLAVGLCVFVGFGLSAQAILELTEGMLKAIESRYGQQAVMDVVKWNSLLLKLQNKDVDQQLAQVNEFLNEYEFIDDLKHWQQTDYWATPIEFIATHGGDCEDFSIAKYFSLRALGVPAANLRLMYVKALRYNMAHMVLAYYAQPNAIPLVLDNLNPKILPATQRQDLVPVYSFNGDGLWIAKEQGQGKKVQPGGNNSLWEDLTKRMTQEFEAKD
jgi:predicted transglutaminase-like cysteine proteinase